MTNFLKYVTGVSFILLTSCATGKIANTVNVTQLPEGTLAPTNALTYTLPKTVLQVEVEAEQMVCKAGPFYNYAEQYLNINTPIIENKIIWQIKSITVHSFGVADKSKTFAISATGDASAQYVTLAQNGVLKGINLPLEQPATQTSEEIINNELTLADVTFDSVPLLEKQLKTTSLAMMAESTANHIYKLRKRQIKLLGFEYEHHPTDATTLETTLAELKKRELIFTQMFTGKCVKQTIKKKYLIVPDSMSTTNAVLFGFSAEHGFVEKNDVNGTPISFKYTPTAKKPKISISAEKKTETKQGIYYCMPAQIELEIYSDNQSYFTNSFFIGQLGTLANLPASAVTRSNISLELDSATGALIRLNTIEPKH